MILEKKGQTEKGREFKLTMNEEERKKLTHFDQHHDVWSVFGILVHSQRFGLLAIQFVAKPFQLDPTKNHSDFVIYLISSKRYSNERLQCINEKRKKKRTL